MIDIQHATMRIMGLYSSNMGIQWVISIGVVPTTTSSRWLYIGCHRVMLSGHRVMLSGLVQELRAGNCEGGNRINEPRLICLRSFYIWNFINRYNQWRFQNVSNIFFQPWKWDDGTRWHTFFFPGGWRRMRQKNDCARTWTRSALYVPL